MMTVWMTRQTASGLIKWKITSQAMITWLSSGHHVGSLVDTPLLILWFCLATLLATYVLKWRTQFLLPYHFIVYLDIIPSPWGEWQHIPLKHLINSRSHAVSGNRTPSADQHIMKARKSMVKLWEECVMKEKMQNVSDYLASVLSHSWEKKLSK